MAGTGIEYLLGTPTLSHFHRELLLITKAKAGAQQE
jgi:hypothetical protein